MSCVGFLLDGKSYVHKFCFTCSSWQPKRELTFIVTMRILMLGFGRAGVAIELKDRGTSVQTAAAVRHLVGSLTRAEGLRFAVVSASILT